MRGTTNIGGKRGQASRIGVWARGRARRAVGIVGLTPRAPQALSKYEVDRVANWTVWKTMPDAYIQANYDSVRIGCHTEGRDEGINQRSERFTEPNQGWTVKMELDRAASLGLGVHLVLDFYHGSGRPDDDGSHTGPGKYHYTWAEGGMRDAIDNVFSWMPPHVISFCVGNEPSDVQWLANQYDQYWMSHAKAKCKARGIPLVGYDGNHLGPMFAKWCNWIDVHAIGSENGRGAQKIRDARRLGLPVVMLEFSAKRIDEYQGELEKCLNEGPLSMGGFPNSPAFPKRGSVYWNWKNHPQFGHTYEGGETDPGQAWNRVLGSGDVDPPPPVPPPPDPPPDPDPDPGEDINLDKVRTQNKKARGALKEGRVKDAEGILKRQAKTLGMS